MFSMQTIKRSTNASPRRRKKKRLCTSYKSVRLRAKGSTHSPVVDKRVWDQFVGIARKEVISDAIARRRPHLGKPKGQWGAIREEPRKRTAQKARKAGAEVVVITASRTNEWPL